MEESGQLPTTATLHLLIDPNTHWAEAGWTSEAVLDAAGRRKSLVSCRWCRETGKFEVDYEIPPCGQVPSARGFITLKRLVRL
jgi:hypothetical protein